MCKSVVSCFGLMQKLLCSFHRLQIATDISNDESAELLATDQAK